MISYYFLDTKTHVLIKCTHLSPSKHHGLFLEQFESGREQKDDERHEVDASNVAEAM